LQTESITVKARQNMQVEVKDLLARRFPIRHKEVDPFAARLGLSQHSGQALSNLEYSAPPQLGLVLQGLLDAGWV
jgi:hypothetical protein